VNFQSGKNACGIKIAICLSTGRPWLLTLLVFCLYGCTEVRAWERGNLSKPQMAMNTLPIQAAFREHVYGSRESASGGAVSSGGGGCGCY
jgi:hypothetical protein